MLEIFLLITAHKKLTVVQIFAIQPFSIIKAISGDTVKVFNWLPGLTYIGFRSFGPVHLGGKGNLRIIAEKEAQRTGRSVEEVAPEVWLCSIARLYGC